MNTDIIQVKNYEIDGMIESICNNQPSSEFNERYFELYSDLERCLTFYKKKYNA